ncbi:hypothetical protein CDD82_1030 [Ophiocordyceps australis]|uniref:Beta-glucosidase cel3A n=1 Tax=Ophiocordyceps australis TaxID=1399860 RepID=A0A2C5Y085_9HYPO|nr:hypothetical protein CDD82_1030 [Ophiocordyceps australis]
MRLALLSALCAVAVGQVRDPGHVITNDSFFYGQSPPVYPSPRMVGREWAHAYSKARALVSQMTLEEKVNLTGGVDLDSACSGSILPIKRLGFPGMCLSDAGNGLRNTDLVNAYPSGIHVGASWNRGIARQRGEAMGGEFRKKGVNVLLGPVVGPAWRVVRGGRNWEGFSVDPLLSGALAAESVSGIQSQGVQTSIKHFVANEQETFRTPSPGREAISANIDDKTMHELYLWPFQDAVRAGTGNVMCSYQRINNSYGCANSKTLNGLLKTELGFQGFVVSDWDAQHAGTASALAGLDMAMPHGDSYWGKKLVEAVNNGSVPESRIDDMATRIMTTWYQFNQDSLFPTPGLGMPKDLTRPHGAIDGRDASARGILLQGAVEGHVLVKNRRNALPLRQPRMVSLFGYSAKSPDAFAPLPGLESQVWIVGGEPIGPEALLSSALNMSIPTIGRLGTMIGGCGSGATTPAVFTSPFESLKTRAARDDTALFYDFVSAEPVVDALSDACIVFGNAWACEGADRPALYDDYTDRLINKVAAQCNNTIVVLHNAGPRVVDGFVEHANVTGVIFAHLPGRDSGEALVSLLYGEANPSGKLPYTVAKQESDYGHLLGPDLASGNFDKFPQSDFKEGVYVDYRYFDRHGIEPRYEFGFGLSYTTFAMSNMSIERVPTGNLGEWPTGNVVAGGQADIWDVVARVGVDVENTGPVAGSEVAQLYVLMPGQGTRQLRGFDKKLVQPGEKVRMQMPLSRRDLSVWDVAAQKWRMQRGRYEMGVGNSSRNVVLRGTLQL